MSYDLEDVVFDDLEMPQVEPADYSYNNLSNHSPVPLLRDGQKDALRQISEAFKSTNIKYIVMQAPAGLGKSICATSLGSAMKDHGSYILTSNIMLQNQYIKDFPSKMSEMKGRSNYQCLDKDHIQKGVDCGKSPCRSSKDGRKQCKDQWGCGYHKAFDKAVNDKVTLMNFSSALCQFNYNQYGDKRFPTRELMIIDEAHLIESQLTGFLEFSITIEKAMQSSELDLPKEDSPAEDYLQMLVHEKIILNQALESQDSPTYEQDLDSYNRCKAIISEIERDPSNIVVQVDTKVVNEPKLTFRPIDVSSHAKKNLFNFCNKTIMMSATIVNYKAYIQSLGISESECVFIDIPSTFPVENRPIYKSYVGKLNYNNMNEIMPKLIDYINKLLVHHKSQKGIIHVPSYKLAEDIFMGLTKENRDRILFPKNSKDIQSFLNRHKESDRSTVLMSPSMSEGLDLAGDLSRFTIITKMPYPSLADKVVKARMNKYPMWYSYTTALKLIQSYGRSIRSETDKAVTYVLDEGFEDVLRRNGKNLPSWFLNAIKM